MTCVVNNSTPFMYCICYLCSVATVSVIDLIYFCKTVIQKFLPNNIHVLPVGFSVIANT